jgi:hypothetical protein
VNRYRISGLTVASDIEMPGLIEAPEPLGEPHVEIRAGAAPEDLAGTQACGPTWAMGSGEFLLHVPGVARFWLRGGRSITYQGSPHADPGDVAAFLVGTVFGILLHQRGLVVLHASSIEADGRAILFLGPSGAGKSTLASALSQRGYRLVADDFCVISLSPGGAPLAHPDGRLPKLWAQAIARLDLGGRQGPPVRKKLAKFYVSAEGRETGQASLPVGAAYVLREARAPLSPGIEQPNVVDATVLVRQNAYRPRLVRQMEQAELYFRRAVAIGRSGVYYLTREMEFDAMAGVIDMLESHWERLSPRAGAA